MGIIIDTQLLGLWALAVKTNKQTNKKKQKNKTTTTAKRLSMQKTKETQVRFLGQEDPLDKGMATHSSILA